MSAAFRDALAVAVGTRLTEYQPLAPYTTYRIGGPARYFVAADSEGIAVAAVRCAVQHQVPCFILGGGSNILVADRGLDGLVLYLNWRTLVIEGDKVTVSSRVEVGELVERTLAANLRGLECLAGVPGEVGGAIRGNAGTFGQQIGDYLRTMRAITPAGEVVEVAASDCGFRYRHSAFKENGAIIVGATLALEPGDGVVGQQLVAERLARRRATQPGEPSAGCVFKNFPFSQIDVPALKRAGLDTDRFAEHQKLPASYVIELLGFKGQRQGQVMVSPTHANFLVNLGGGTASDVLALIALIKAAAWEQYQLRLEEEIQIVGR